jgi:anti-anti-sigma factor
VTTVGPPPARFGVVVDLEDEQAVLGVAGDVDLLSASVLGSFVDAVITNGYTSVVLDLAEVSSIDVTLGAVVASVASRLVAAGGRLTIRSASPAVARVLDIAWLAAVISLENPRPGRERLGPEQSATARRLPVVATLPGTAHVFGEATAIRASGDYVDGALRLVVALAQATVGGADGASVSLQRHGRLATVAASDRTVSEMDANQYATGEGPCVDASLKGRWFHAESLEEETRWPTFTPRARALGISAILSSPLVAQGRSVGALNIYSQTPAAFAQKDQELAAVFAAEASILLSDALVQATIDDQRARWLEGALRTREIIAEAHGVIMERENVVEGDAFAILRRFSQKSNRPLVERAQDIVASTRQPDPELAIGP